MSMSLRPSAAASPPSGKPSALARILQQQQHRTDNPRRSYEEEAAYNQSSHSGSTDADLSDSLSKHDLTVKKIPDSLRPSCPNCNSAFTNSERCHQCRLCSNVFCDTINNTVGKKESIPCVASLDTKGSYDVAACCLCHCCLDFSDRAAFFREDREEDYSDDGDAQLKVDIKDGDKDNNQNAPNVNAIQNCCIVTEDNSIVGQTCKDMKSDTLGLKSPEMTKRGSEAKTNEPNSNKNKPRLSINLDSSIRHDVNGTSNNPHMKRNQSQDIDDDKESGMNGNSERSSSNIDLALETLTAKNVIEGKGMQRDNDDESSYFFRRYDPFLPKSLYDPDNAVLYCDSCDRLFHQKCHFVPVLQIPKGNWNCLICTTKKSSHNARDLLFAKTKKKKKKKVDLVSYSEDLYKSPPIASVHEQELAWESDPKVVQAKAELLKQWTSLSGDGGKACNSKLKRLVGQYIQGARLAEAALTTLTSTSQNRKHCYSVETGKPSQELVDSMVKFFTAKYRLKRLIHNINYIREAAPQIRHWDLLLEWCLQYKNQYASFIERVIFPFGMRYSRRWEPRSPELNDALKRQVQNTIHKHDQCLAVISSIPEEIVLRNRFQSENRDDDKYAKADEMKQVQLTKRDQRKGKNAQSSGTCSRKTERKNQDESDASFSLDGLTCSVCLLGTTTDENDLVLCDGEGCYRAFHMNCTEPKINHHELEKQESWFCPWCTAVADWLFEVQCHWRGDEWEKKKLGYSTSKTKRIEDNSSSSTEQSWQNAHDVFPESDWEYENSLKLKAGKNDLETNRLLSQVLGLDDDNNIEQYEDEDNLDVDGNFDLNSYEVDRCMEREKMKKQQLTNEAADNDPSSSTHSSEATLVEMSSVELEISKEELAALSDVDDDGNAEEMSKSSIIRTARSFEVDNNEEKGRNCSSRLRSRQQRKAQQPTKYSEDVEHMNQAVKDNDPGKMDERNILSGKRTRKPVDYRRLNDALFGGYDKAEVENLDGGDDYVMRPRKDMKATRAMKKCVSSKVKPSAKALRSR